MPTRDLSSDVTLVSDTARGLSRAAVWTIAGNGTYAIAQWALLAFVARLSGAAAAGEYALALALSAPVLLLANLQLRDVQAVDVAGRHPLRTYLRLRLLTTLVAIPAIAVVGATFGPARALPLILAIAAGKAVEGVGDILLGELQRHERMDLVGKSLVAKSLLSTGAFVGTLLVSRNVPTAAAALALALALVVWLVDSRFVSRLPRVPPRGARLNGAALSALLRTALPLGFAISAFSLTMQVPRYFLERHSGLHEVGIHAGILNLLVAPTLLLTSLGQVAAPRLARAYSRRDVRRFLGVALGIAAIALAMGAGGALTSLGLGGQVLALLYGSAFATRGGSLALAFAIGTAYYLASALGFAATAAHVFRGQAVLMLIVSGVSVLSSWALVPRLGLDGALWAFGLSSFTLACGQALLVGIRLIAPPAGVAPHEGGGAAEREYTATEQRTRADA